MILKTWLTPVTQRWSCTTIGIRPSYVAYMWICKLCRSKVFARLSLYEALRIAMTYAANVWISDLSLTIQYRGRRVIGISGSLIWSKTLMELIFNACVKFWWSPEGPVIQIHSPHLLVGAPGIFSNLLRFVQMLKREWGAESNGKLPHLFIPSKTAT